MTSRTESSAASIEGSTQIRSPSTGASAAPVNISQASPSLPPHHRIPHATSSYSSSSSRSHGRSIPRRLLGPLVRPSLRGLTHYYGRHSGTSAATSSPAAASSSRSFPGSGRTRSRSHDMDNIIATSPPSSPGNTSPRATVNGTNSSAGGGGSPGKRGSSLRKANSDSSVAAARARARSAQRQNDSMVYLDGPQVYTCAQCRTHLTSHDDIISKSFHGRHGRAYLFDQCVNVTIGPAEDRLLITGLHSVCDIFCKRCKSMIGWTYAKAYESSQKYKEGKFIIEKINLHIEESDYYDISHPAGERTDRFRRRTMSWGSENSGMSAPASPRSMCGGSDIVYEYRPSSSASSWTSPRDRMRSASWGGSGSWKPSGRDRSGSGASLPPPPVL